MKRTASDKGGGQAAGSASLLPQAVTVGAAAIAARLRQAILDGSYADGERLPAERDLASHFEASRSTVRGALRRLEEMNLVTRRVGSGTFISYRPVLAPDNIAELTSPIELIDVRVALEPQMTRLVVVNATARDLDRMGEALERVEDCGGDRERFSKADEHFHLMLAECTRNPLMVWLYRQINEVRGHAQWAAMKDKILTPDRIAEYNRQHRALFDALRSRDVDAAVRTITEHLEKARRDLRGADAR
ncbi:MAG: FadR/GntR family transcriptional regulator [Kiloniellaceae bacterium]